MMRTPRQAIKDAMSAIQAFADGKEIQWSYADHENWQESIANNPAFSDSIFKFRPKPEPKPPAYRPWTIDEVPRGGWLRKKDESEECQIIGKQDGLASVAFCGRTSMQELLDQWTLINPDGTTSPCGVEVKE